MCQSCQSTARMLRRYASNKYYEPRSANRIGSASWRWRAAQHQIDREQAAFLSHSADVDHRINAECVHIPSDATMGPKSISTTAALRTTKNEITTNSSPLMHAKSVDAKEMARERDESEPNYGYDKSIESKCSCSFMTPTPLCSKATAPRTTKNIITANSSSPMPAKSGARRRRR